MNNNILIIFTNSYPYGNGEQYLENELIYYSNKFKRIIFIPIKVYGKARTMSENSEVLKVHSKVKFPKYMYFGIILKFINAYLLENKIRKSKIAGNIITYYKLFYNAYMHSIYIIKWLKEEGIKPNDIIFYSYWFYHWVTVMSVIKKTFKFSKFISRAHLNDIYDYLNFNFWGGLKVESMDKIITISNHAKNYFIDNYKIKNEVLSTIRLGVKSSIKLNPINQENKLIFVSCSSIRKEKRLDFIVSVLNEIKLDIKWIHFGEGEMRDEIEQLVTQLPPNIEVELKGFVINEKILNFYESYPIDLFLNLSSEEGIPVSLMEAISYGIPVLAIDVFGNSEIVNKTTGLLFKLEDNAKTISQKIKLFINSKIDRKKIADFQKKFYSAELNYSEFEQILIHNE